MCCLISSSFSVATISLISILASTFLLCLFAWRVVTDVTLTLPRLPWPMPLQCRCRHSLRLFVLSQQCMHCRELKVPAPLLLQPLLWSSSAVITMTYSAPVFRAISGEAIVALGTSHHPGHIPTAGLTLHTNYRSCMRVGVTRWGEQCTGVGGGWSAASVGLLYRTVSRYAFQERDCCSFSLSYYTFCSARVDWRTCW